MKKLGEYRGFEVYDAIGYSMNSYDDLDEGVIYIATSGSMYLNGRNVGTLERKTGRVLAWDEDGVRKTWPEKREWERNKRAPVTFAASGVEDIDELVTFNLDNFLKDINISLDEALEVAEWKV